MERGVYFDGWYHEHFNYHPSLPPRRLTMLEDVDEMGATALVWAGLGGGVLSLPYLEEEAWGEIPARFRHYGFVNDSEFIAHARDRGIDLFAIVFEEQAWEVGAEVVDGTVTAQVEMRGTAPMTSVGLTEFATDTGPATWKPFRHYFPDGLVNSAGEQVTDLHMEVAAHGLDGEPYHTVWVEAKRPGQNSHLADRNNPVWREYLKQVIKIQIDAGAPGIQLDEADTPHLAFAWGGCFCKDCIAVFRTYLQGLPAEELPEVLGGEDLASFDYRQWLLARGHRQGENPRTFPLYEQYWWAIMLNLPRTFRELTDFAREHASTTGKEIRLGSNFFNCVGYYDPFIDEVDLVITEMAQTEHQQPWFYRHAVGFARGLDVVAVEGPYSGVMEQLRADLKRGRAFDRFALSIFEANAMGANMSLPYGSWLGTGVKDSYYAPRELAVAVGQFQKSVAALTTNASRHRTAVVFSPKSQLRVLSQIHPEGFQEFFERLPEDEGITGANNRYTPYFDVLERLSRTSHTYDVVTMPFEEMRAGGPTAQDLSRYETVVVPVAFELSTAQNAVLHEYLEAGGKVVVIGDYAADVDEVQRAQVLEHPRTTVLEGPHQVDQQVGDVVEVDLGELGAVSVHALEDGTAAVHLLNFDYDEDADAVREKIDVPLTVTLGDNVTTATLHRPGREPENLQITGAAGGSHSLTVPALGTYAVIHLA